MASNADGTDSEESSISILSLTTSSSSMSSFSESSYSSQDPSPSSSDEPSENVQIAGKRRSRRRAKVPRIMYYRHKILKHAEKGCQGSFPKIITRTRRSKRFIVKRKRPAKDTQRHEKVFKHGNTRVDSDENEYDLNEEFENLADLNSPRSTTTSYDEALYDFSPRQVGWFKKIRSGEMFNAMEFQSSECDTTDSEEPPTTTTTPKKSVKRLYKNYVRL